MREFETYPSRLAEKYKKSMEESGELPRELPKYVEMLTDDIPDGTRTELVCAGGEFLCMRVKGATRFFTLGQAEFELCCEEVEKPYELTATGSLTFGTDKNTPKEAWKDFQESCDVVGINPDGMSIEKIEEKQGKDMEEDHER